MPAKRQTRPLNERQRQFCRLLVEGRMSQQDAYRAAYPKATPAAAAVNATKLLRNAKVQELMKELRSQIDTVTVLTAERKRTLLKDCAEDGELPWVIRLKAIDLDNRMAGDLAPSGFALQQSKVITPDEQMERAKMTPETLERMNEHGIFTQEQIDEMFREAGGAASASN